MTSDKSLALTVNSDGGSRGNPGNAACAAVVVGDDGGELLTRARTIGVATNNVAEYEGAVMALEMCRELRASRVHLRMDSELIVRQIEGRYKVRHPDLKPYFLKVKKLISTFESFSVEHVKRGENKRADALVNDVLDGREDA